MTSLRPSGALQGRIRTVNEANGWAVPTDANDRTAVVARLALAITEVCEAIEVVRTSPIDYGHLAEEVADVVIRLLDLGTGLGIEVIGPDEGVAPPIGYDVSSTDGLVAALGVIATAISRLLDRFDASVPGNPPAPDIIRGGLVGPCLRVIAFADTLGLDLSAAIEAKISRNAARGFRHGGRTI